MSKRSEWKPLLDYSWLDDLLEEAEIYLITHEVEVVLDEDGWHVIDPVGCWLIAPPAWSMDRAIQVAAIFVFLYFNGCSPPIAESLAFWYVHGLSTLNKPSTDSQA